MSGSDRPWRVAGLCQLDGVEAVKVGRAPAEVDPTRMCELLVRLPEVTVLDVVEEVDGPLWVHIETRGQRPVCAGCGGAVVIKDRPVVALVDLLLRA